MPSEKDEVSASEDVVKNVNFDDVKKKKNKKNEIEKKFEDESSEDEEEDIVEDDDEDDDDDDEDEDDDDEVEGITDVGLYNVLGSYLMDEEGNSIGVSLSNIAKELAKLNHLVKKYSKN